MTVKGEVVYFYAFDVANEIIIVIFFALDLAIMLWGKR
jgi:hypothetical protein